MDDAALDAELLAQMREDFLAEAGEILEGFPALLIRWEEEKQPEQLQTLFRNLHTLKGAAGFVGLVSFQTLAHAMEDVFGALRGGTIEFSPEIIDLGMTGIEMLSRLRDDVVHGGSGEAPMGELLERMQMVREGRSIESVKLEPVPEPVVGGESTLRVRTADLDRMMVLVGEMVTLRNTLQAVGERLKDSQLDDTLTAVSRLTHQLQGVITEVRLTPVERLFTRFSSVVRNLARDHQKEVRLEISGAETPVDRSVSELMYDPLVHLLRNAVDHGLELPAERGRQGKDPVGTIRLSAERRGETILLKISDDGRGIDPRQVRRAALQKGVLTREEGEKLSENQMVRLIFRPGFSTRSNVTATSGRGVGLDVVQEHVRRLRGHIDVVSQPGAGTTFIVQLPLLLSILPVLTVRVGARIYAVPLHYVRETLQVRPEAVQWVYQQPLLFIQGVALPVYSLAKLLGDEGKELSTGPGPALVVRLAQGDEVWRVDELIGKQRLVVKPLDAYLGSVRGVDGSAILPDGSVTLILDIEGIAQGIER